MVLLPCFAKDWPGWHHQPPCRPHNGLICWLGFFGFARAHPPPRPSFGLARSPLDRQFCSSGLVQGFLPVAPLLAADLCDDVAQYLDQLLHHPTPKVSLPPPAQKGGLNRFRAAVHSTQDLLSLMSKAKELHMESEHLPLIIAMRSTLRCWGRVPHPKDPPHLLSSAQQAANRVTSLKVRGLFSVSAADINLYIPSKLLLDDQPSAHLLGLAPNQGAQVRFLNGVPSPWVVSMAQSNRRGCSSPTRSHQKPPPQASAC